MTLKRLRRDAPPQDRNVPALVPKVKPQWATSKDGSRYVAISLYPRTLDELRELGRDFGEAAVAESRWGAISLWLMKEDPIGLRHPYRVASGAVQIAREHDRFHLGWPRHDGGAWPTPALDGLTPDHQYEVQQVAADTRADWEAAGSPYLDADRIKPVFQYLTSCPAFIAKYIGPETPATDTQDNS